MDYYFVTGISILMPILLAVYGYYIKHSKIHVTEFTKKENNTANGEASGCPLKLLISNFSSKYQKN